MLANPDLFLQDIQKFNYRDLNSISKKHGEKTFNPREVIGDNYQYNFDSDEDPVLKKFQ